MKTLTSLLIVMVSLPAFSQDRFDEIMVSQEWLLNRLGDKSLVIVHVAEAENYEKGHIPGAQLIMPEEFAVHGDLRWQVPSLEQMDKTLRSKGITNETINVLYYGGDFFAGTYRLYFTMDYLGLSENTFILDGGLPGWISKKLDVTKDVPDVKPSEKLNLKPNKALIADKGLVSDKCRQEEGVSIIDARRASYYLGEEQANYARPGHIANAKNITWTELVDENKFLKSAAELRAYFDAAGIGPQDEIITYCHVGLRATVLYTISKGLGYEPKLYDGSFNEWHNLGDDEYPTETGN